MNLFTQAHFFRFISHILFIAGFCAALLLASLPAHAQPAYTILASKTISLENRYADTWVNEVFADNILLTMAYMHGMEKTASPDWNAVRQPFTHEFTLAPGEAFAYHDTAYLPQYAQRVVKTTNAHYAGHEGFRSSGKLMGDGVCHLASLFYWAAKDAGLEAVSPVNHDFAAIPEIEKQYGVAIYSDPTNTATSMQQNLYITNNKAVPLTFRTIYNGKELTFTVLQEK